MSLAKLLQLYYNLQGQYLPVSKKTRLHKFLYIKDMGGGQKFDIVFNGLRELVSDID
jgi:hypothetical protein